MAMADCGALCVLRVRLSRSAVRKYMSGRQAQQGEAVSAPPRAAIKQAPTKSHRKNGRPSNGRRANDQPNDAQPIAIDDLMYQPVVRLRRERSKENHTEPNVNNNGKVRAKSKQSFKEDSSVSDSAEMTCSVLMKKLSEQEIELAMAASAPVAAKKPQAKRPKSQQQSNGNEHDSKRQRVSRRSMAKSAGRMKLPPFDVGRFHKK